jgi:glycosyltransferase involved in cell wall biosynthesis
MTRSATHLVLIPSYNTGALVLQTVSDARRQWGPVWVVIDGSTDGTLQLLQRLATDDPCLQVFVLPRNQGKGAAVLYGLQIAQSAGFSHALIMDADGQHPPDRIRDFMAASMALPGTMVLGVPVFSSNAPVLRVSGRRISNCLASVETLGKKVDEALFGFRVYPIAPTLRVMRSTRWMRRFDFEPEVAVRLCWQGVPVINIPAAVRYLSRAEGQVSHFRYGRDNLLLTWMHVRLMLELLTRLSLLVLRRT